MLSAEERKLKRIKDNIEWCDNIQNNSDEEQRYKDDAKRITYDNIRKIITDREDQ